MEMLKKVHPERRVYDSPEFLRQHALLHIRSIEEDMRERIKRIKEMKGRGLGDGETEQH